MDQSPRNALTYLAPAQAQKHVTVNETFRRLDQLTHMSVMSATLDAEPPAPADGEAWLLPAGASGDVWSAWEEGDIAAFQDGAWAQFPPQAGWRVFVEDEKKFIVYDGSAWGQPAMAGVNAAPDAVNRLSVKSDAVLFSHDDVTPGTGDCRVAVNKNNAAGAASLLFQSGFSGRAEIGLAGDDVLRVKTSADGAAWDDVIVINNANGNMGLGESDPQEKLHIAGGNLRIANTGGAASAVIERMDGVVGALQAGASAVRFNFDEAGDFAISTNAAANIISGAAGAAGKDFIKCEGASENLILMGEAAGNVGIGVSAPAARLDIDGAVRVRSYPVAGAPSASANGAGAIIFVSDEASGPTLAFSDGTDWRRVADGAVIS